MNLALQGGRKIMSMLEGNSVFYIFLTLLQRGTEGTKQSCKSSLKNVDWRKHYNFKA